MAYFDEEIRQYETLEKALAKGAGLLNTAKPELLSPDHIRLGVEKNAVMIAGLAELLIKKGVCTFEDLHAAAREAMDERKAQMEAELDMDDDEEL